MTSKQKQLNNKVGLYMRLSKDDERQGESLSIENQRTILTKYVAEKGWTVVDEYIDDGYSGTNFERPEVQRLLEDAQSGRIDTIIVKDLSRFGRNYIYVGQYIDYVFPQLGIRFIALSENVDTADKNSSGMDMMPIMNIFNEFHSANTSKKIRAVVEATAKEGKYRAAFAPYGYKKGTGDKCLPVIDEESAPIVKRIFEMRAEGKKLQQICDVLNAEHILTPALYIQQKTGISPSAPTKGLWIRKMVHKILVNPIYIGTLVRLRKTRISYKNKKQVDREPYVFPNVIEPIIDQKLWDRCQEIEQSVSRGKRTCRGFLAPLSGLLFCSDCGGKMRLGWNTYGSSKKHPEPRIDYIFACGNRSVYGKNFCTNHNIKLVEIEQIVLEDIRSYAILVLANENKARADFLKNKEQLSTAKINGNKKALAVKQRRFVELDKLIQATYEDKVLGKIPEDICIKLLAKYTEEQQLLSGAIETLEIELAKSTKNETDVDEFIRRIKQYVGIPKLTRNVCLELIDRIVVGAKPKDKNSPREITIFYKFLHNN